MHRTLKRLFGLALAAALTATVGTGAFAAELVIFNSDKRELYQRYAQEPAVLTVCEDCGGALQAQDTAAGRWFDTGFTRDCEEGVAYTGLDMLEARTVRVQYACAGCGASATAAGYERRWVCYDPDGCAECGGQRTLQTSEPGEWALTGGWQECSHGHMPYYNDIEESRTVEKTFVCESCGETETRTDAETRWRCTGEEAAQRKREALYR